MGFPASCPPHEPQSVPWTAPLCVLVGLAVAACLGETELVTPPPAPPATLILEFKPDAEDLETARALGWENGIPDVEVTLTPEDSEQGTPIRLQGSAAGTLQLDELSGGRYVVDAVRWLTAAERDQLAAEDDAVGFVARFSLVTATAPSPVPARLVTSRRRGIILSEWYRSPHEDPAIDLYPFSGYIRLYNNADTTIHLDGLFIGLGYAQQFDLSPNWPCGNVTHVSNDPNGIWALYFHQLPGGGTDFPLGPGQTAVVATDAIDHRPLVPGGLDLRRADFEFLGFADVDNPAVPNAPEMGRTYFFGHGIFFNVLANVVFVSLPVDPATLTRTQVPPATPVWSRFPKDRLLEVVAIKTSWSSGRAECAQMVHASFDREPVKLLGVNAGDDLLALRRVPVPFTVNGQPVLQHTRTSARDFTAGPRDPFAKP